MSSIKPSSFLLVDGYNVIGAWTCLKKVRDVHGLEMARQELVEVLINYTALKGFQTQIVFDAHYQQTPSHEEKYTQSLSVYYTAYSQTADTYIERFCADFRHQSHFLHSPNLIVATSDEAQRRTVIGYGATCYSAQRLKIEVDSSRHVHTRKKPSKSSQGRFLFHSLDETVQKRLQDLRNNLS